MSFGSGSELLACDWVYAADFAARATAAYLGGYSGRVVMVDQRGEGLRVYEVGVVPQRIIDTGQFQYILASPALYVLRDDSLINLVDGPDDGELVMAQGGFGLLETRTLRWFGKDGQLLGTVLSKGPIRRIYCSGEGLVVESRRRRGRQRAPRWWK